MNSEKNTNVYVCTSRDRQEIIFIFSKNVRKEDIEYALKYSLYNYGKNMEITVIAPAINLDAAKLVRKSGRIKFIESYKPLSTLREYAYYKDCRIEKIEGY